MAHASKRQRGNSNRSEQRLSLLQRAHAAPAAGRQRERDNQIRSGACRRGAGDADAAEVAVAVGVLGQILRVVVLGVEEFWRVHDFGRDRAATGFGEFGLIGCAAGLGGGFLGVTRGVDAGAVLRAGVVALAHALRRVVGFPEQLQQLVEGNLRWVIDNAHRLVVAGQAGADFVIGGVRRDACLIANSGDPHALLLPEQALHAPEAAHAEENLFQAFGHICRDWSPVDEMGLRGGSDRALARVDSARLARGDERRRRARRGGPA